MATCNFDIPGNVAAKDAEVTLDGNKVTVSGSDWAHTSKLEFNTAKVGYSQQDSWFGVSYAPVWKPGRNGHVGNEAVACGIKLGGKQTEIGRALILIGRQLHSGVLRSK